MDIGIEEFIYCLAALRVHDEFTQPKEPKAPWMWSHFSFSDHFAESDGIAMARFIATGDPQPRQPGCKQGEPLSNIKRKVH